MLRKLHALLIVGSLVGAYGPAVAAPVSVAATLEIRMEGLGALSFGSSGIVTVSGSTVIVPAGLLSLSSSIAVPVTGLSGIHSLGMQAGLANFAGTFRMGGVTSQAPTEVCVPPLNPGWPLGTACNAGGGVGGVLGLSGVLSMVVIPVHVVVPLELNQMRLGQGGSTNVPFVIDAAAWTTRTAYRATSFKGTASYTGAGSPLTLVTPVYINALGTLFPTLATLRIVPIPEPAPVLMVFIGVLGLVALARGRKRP